MFGANCLLLLAMSDELGVYLVPDLSVKQLLDAIPYVAGVLDATLS
jgi:hypothetical protein